MNCIDSESLGSSHSSPTAQYHQYGSGAANSHSVAQLAAAANFIDVLASSSNDTDQLAAAVVGSVNGNNGLPGSSNGLTGATNSSSSNSSNRLGVGSNLLPQSLSVLSANSAAGQGASSSFWNNLDAVSKANNGSLNLLNNSSQVAQSFQSGASSLADFNKPNGLNPVLLNAADQLRSSQLKAAAALGLQGNGAGVASQVNGHMSALRNPLHQQLQAGQQQVS